MAKLYTKTGDDGTTTTHKGDRVPKSDLYVEIYGALDELNSILGLVRAVANSPSVQNLLRRIQTELLQLGSILDDPESDEILESYTARLERDIDQLNVELPPLKDFIAPGKNIAEATCHIARCTCRRTERLFSRLRQEKTLHSCTLTYLNRLSDLLFVIARALETSKC